MIEQGPARLTVLSGFLGSGKTTWLARQIHHGVFSGASLLINEAADAPVDDTLLGAPGARLIAGGCVCCVRRAELVDTLADMTWSGARHIVLETSGLADPGAIREAVAGDPRLEGRLILGEVVVTVDCAQGLELLRREALARRQVAAADALIVTKPALAALEEAQRLAATLQLMAPRAQLFAAERGVDVPAPQAGDAEPELLDPLADDAAGEPVTAVSLDLSGKTDWPSFALWLSALLHARGDSVLRVKGILRDGERRILVQAAGRAVEASEIAQAPEDALDRVVLIGRGFTEDDLYRSLAAFSKAG